MPIRWVICPFVLVEGPEAGAIIEDPEEPGGTKINPFKLDRYESKARSLIYGRVQTVAHVDLANGSLCLCQVRANDLSPLDADPQVISVFEQDEAAFDNDFGEGMTMTLREAGWTQAKTTRIRNKLTNLGVDLTGFTLDSTFRDVLRAIKQAIRERRLP